MQRRHLRRLLRAVSLCATLCVADLGVSQAQPEAVSQQIFTLPMGPHRVGFQSRQEVDPSRGYRSGQQASSDTQSRPMHVHLWYPATSGGSPMRYGDYVSLYLADEGTVQSAGPGAASATPRMAAARLSRSWDLPGEPPDTELQAATPAWRDAPPVRGRFPLIVYAPGADGVAWENSVLCEYLASHGYVVIAVPSHGEHSAPMTIDLPGVGAQVQDIEWLIGYAASLPFVDRSQLALMGWSWGGLASALVKTRRDDIRAIVGLDGSIAYRQHYEKFVAFPGASEDRIDVPLLFLQQATVAGPKPLPDLAPEQQGQPPVFFRKLRHSDALWIRMGQMMHEEFSSAGHRIERPPMLEALRKDPSYADPSYEGDGWWHDIGAANRGYEIVASYALQFLEAHLRRSVAAQAWLAAPPAAHGFSDTEVVAQAAATRASAAAGEADEVDFRWGVKIPMRDGVQLNATAYTPRGRQAPAPCIFTLTPYISQTFHDRGMYFAAHGMPFLTVDSRGRGNSGGEFRPFLQEAQDGHDVVEWLAQQPYCNGKVSMWGGSYGGYVQWATAAQFPPHLAGIVPVAAPYPGVDHPMLNNVFYPYGAQWLNLTGGRTSQDRIFGDEAFWFAANRRWFESGRPFREVDAMAGVPSPVFQEWVSHPHPDAYWDAYSPTAAQYAKLSIPILTITGSYDGDQSGAFTYYREYMKNATPAGRARHYLVIGPWDHEGTRTPQAEFGGLRFGEASLVDLQKLHLEWYRWTMQDGPKPQFLEKAVAYYVMGAEEWRHADSIEAITAESRPYFLGSATNADDVLSSGFLTLDRKSGGAPDQYRHDPRDVGLAGLESSVSESNWLTEQRMVYARKGRQLAYHSAPFAEDTEISGHLQLTAWIAIDQPDTDFAVAVYEIQPDGSSILLATDLMRARYRESFREPKLIRTRAPLRYEFSRFAFVSRQVGRGSRLRLVIGPVHSIHYEKNYHAGGVVAEESTQDARPVTVRLYHDREHPSVLQVPIGR